MGDGTRDLFFWSQNLDNRGEDLVVVWNGSTWRKISDPAEQEAVVGRVTDVRTNGERLRELQSVRIDFAATTASLDPGRFLLDVETEQKDVADRTSYFICYGSAEGIEQPEHLEKVLEAILEFGAKYGRTPVLNENQLRTVLFHVQDKKKALTNLRLVLAGVGGLAIGGLILLGIGLWMKIT